MNSMAMSLAALILSGVKSRASILVDTSIASIMSMPSVSTLSICSDDLGRAIAMMIITRASVLSRNGKCLMTFISPLPVRIHGTMVDTLKWGFLSLNSRYR